MNCLTENKYIEEMECGQNFAYILNDTSMFSSTEYKVLQSQTGHCFVKCMKMMYNGKIQLYYLTSGLKSLSSIISSLDIENVLTIISNLLSNIVEVKHNGFLSCQNVDSSFNHIYVDPATLKVSLVYLPLNKRMFDDIDSFEEYLRTSLIKLLSSISTLSSSKTVQIISDLSNGTLSLEDIQIRFKGGITPQLCKGNQKLRLIAIDAPVSVEIEVDKDEFKIGKKQELVDGVISFNKMISRLHCKINCSANQYTITDLQSANGTYVNKVRLQPNQAHPINNGDVIRLANSNFQVRIG